MTISGQTATLGNVGIGTNTPTYPLDVNGDIRTTGNIISNGVIEGYATVGAGQPTPSISFTHDASSRKLVMMDNTQTTPDMSGDTTINITNFDAPIGYATNVSYVVTQGATPYIISAITLSTSGTASSTPLTIHWQGGSAPTGTANGIDIFSFTIFRTGTNTYTVLANMVDYS